MKHVWGAHNRWIAPVCGLVLFIVGFVVGRTSALSGVQLPHALRESGYKYIAPVLLCNTTPNQDYNKDTALTREISAYIDKMRENTVSVYYFELHSGGKWAGINENNNYAPASMLKVPTMLAVLKYADSHADFLSKEIYFDGSFDDNKAEYFKPQQVIKPYRSYTVDQLLMYTIAYSDNNATRLLNASIDQPSLEAIYVDLGIQLPADATENIDFMSARTYSFFLRVLYNSTYLSRGLSEKALALMTRSDFPQGLQAGIPTSVEVAEKFGERQVFTPNGTLSYRELHDCGIVYAPNNPYILCVMTQGQEFNSLVSTIQGISKIVYDNAQRRNGQ